MRENNKIELEKLKGIYRNCDAFMICSTQNQVVNYIPIMNMIDTKKNEKSNEVSIYNMTYSYPQKSNGKDKKLGRFHNNEWDENLNTILYNNELIKKCEKLNIKKENEILLNIELKRNYNEKSYKDKITGEIEDKKNIVWNMTGGQRSILLTVLKIIQESPKEQHHTLIYMEGNTNRLIVGDYNEKTVGDYTGKIVEYKELNGIYECKDLTIELVFQLAGFSVSKINDENRIRFGEGDKEEKKIKEEIKILWEYYSGTKFGINLRENLLRVQSESKENKEYKLENAWKQLYEEIEKSKEENKIKEYADKLEKRGKDNNRLGYWLEEFLFYRLYKIIKDFEKEWKKNNQLNLQNYFLEMGHSIKLNGEDGKFSEFDVVLLTKSGQLIIFECKSGAIVSDTAKARIYTSYAVAGVYGTPILIPAYLTQDEDRLKNNDNSVWKKMQKTKSAAERAQMDIWLLDDKSLQKEMKSLYDDVLN